MLSFEATCEVLARAIQGTFRNDLIADLGRSADLGSALRRLGHMLRAHVLKAGTQTVDLRGSITERDEQTRADGFHAMHDWDGKAGAVSEDSIPVDVLNFLVDERGTDRVDRKSLAVLVDYYFLHVLALLSLRIWDEGDPDEHLDRLDRLVRHLQTAGSGHQFISRGATLMLIATAHYEPAEHGFHALLENVKKLSKAHQREIAHDHAASLGCHLRFGYEGTYGHDVVLMRNDNAADYPWLRFAAETTLEHYAELRSSRTPIDQRRGIVEAILNALSGDPMWVLKELTFDAHRAELTREMETLRPKNDAYSPLALFFNFSHNIVKGAVVDAVLWGEPRSVSFNDLLTGADAADPENAPRLALATTLMQYARNHPDRVRGKLMPVIVYDPAAGRRAFATVVRALTDGAAAASA